MPNKQNQYDVIVVGAGLIGAAFALKLVQCTELNILLVDRSSRLTENRSPNQRVLALGNIATDLLKEIGVFAKLESQNCHSYRRMFVWDENSNGELEFTAQEYEVDRLGYMVDAIALTMLLQKEMDRHPQISVNYEQTPESLVINSDEACLSTRLDGGKRSVTEFTAPLIVAADGVNSWCRQQAKIFTNTHDYQQKGIVARIETQLPHLDTAWQIFLSSGPLGLLPLADNQCSIVWSAENEMAEKLVAQSDTDFSQSLARTLQHRLGDVKLLSARQEFPLASIKAESYFKHRLVLIGDAAHSIHPLAGQGANLGFKDVRALVDQISIIDDPKKIGELAILDRYQRARKADNEQTDMLMNFLHKAYKNDSALWSSMRGVGMNWIAGSQRIKSMLAKQALGQI